MFVGVSNSAWEFICESGLESDKKKNQNVREREESIKHQDKSPSTLRSFKVHRDFHTSAIC